MPQIKSGHDSALKHCTGEAIYVADMAHQECLHLAFASASCASGTIVSIDTSEAQSSPGVVAVLTASDIPGTNDIGPLHLNDDPLFADQEIMFYGQPVCMVVANDYLTARKAAARVRIVVESQEPVISLEQSLMEHGDISPEHVMSTGTVDHQPRADSCHVKGRIQIGGQEHFYLEGQACLVQIVEGNQVRVWSSSQHPSEVQKIVASLLGLSIAHVQVEVRRMGGAFGGKESQASQWASAASLAAWHCRRPVICQLDRDDDMVMTGKRHDFIGDYKVRFDQQGVIDSASIDLASRCGHSLDLSNAISDRAMFHADNAYCYPNTDISCRRMRTNTVSNTAFRGFGGPQGMMVAEEIIDAIARDRGEDPLTIRKRNLYGEARGTTTPYHMEVDHQGLAGIIEQLETTSDYWRRREQIRAYNKSSHHLYRGLALTPVKFGISFTTTFLNQAGALLHVYRDGSVSINHGGTEMGQGLFAKVATIVARELSIDSHHVHVTATSTDKVPNTSPTAASSGTDMNGMAAMVAARTIKRRLIAFICSNFNATEKDVLWNNGQVDVGDKTLSFAELVELAYMHRVHLSATGYYRTPDIFYDRDQASGTPFYYFSCGAAVSEVVINRLTGESRVLAVDIVHDVGHSIDEAIDRGQIEGGFIQGMGWLTSEELYWDSAGRLRTHSPSTYKIPTCHDRPEHFSIALVDKENPGKASVHGSKAVGEPPLMLAISVFRAISDAISAIGNYQHLPELDAPATPERILMAAEKMIQKQ